VNCFTIRADRKLRRITPRHPHLAAQRLHWRTGDRTFHDLRLFYIVGETLMIAVVGSGDALLKERSAAEFRGFQGRGHPGSVEPVGDIRKIPRRVSGMATVNLTEQTFSQTITGNPIVLVDFWASWCGPCRSFAPVYETVSEDNPDIVFAKVDTEAEQGLAGAFQISSIPTLMAIRDGVVLYSQAGALPEAALVNLVQAVRDVNMDDVRASIAAEKAEDSSA
jgi:thioredoxin 1